MGTGSPCPPPPFRSFRGSSSDWHLACNAPPRPEVPPAWSSALCRPRSRRRTCTAPRVSGPGGSSSAPPTWSARPARGGSTESLRSGSRGRCGRGPARARTLPGADRGGRPRVRTVAAVRESKGRASRAAARPFSFRNSLPLPPRAGVPLRAGRAVRLRPPRSGSGCPEPPRRPSSLRRALGAASDPTRRSRARGASASRRPRWWSPWNRPEGPGRPSSGVVPRRRSSS